MYIESQKALIHLAILEWKVLSNPQILQYTERVQTRRRIPPEGPDRHEAF